MRIFGGISLLLLLLLHPATLWAKDRLIIMAGQSNMMGRGKTFHLPANYKNTPKNIAFFYQGRPHKLAEFAFFGPEVAFAHEVARAFPQDRIILVKQAATGSSIKQWQPDGDGGYSGTLTMDIVGQPVKMTADFSLVPSGKGCVYRIEHRTKCSIPLVGGAVAKFAQAQVEQGCEAEFAYAVKALKSR